MFFDDLPLCEALLRAARELGFDRPTPIQASAIPAALDRRDLLAAAQTGTGKTAAFALPVLERLASGPAEPRPRALVLVPTRELAAQVGESFRALGRHLPLRLATVTGGVSPRPQIEALARGADVVVATPGRLLDHLRSGVLDLSAVAVLVLDEADRMLDMGFIRDIRRILAALPRERQNLMFSATFSAEIRALARSFLRDPVSIEVAPRNAPAERIEHSVHLVEPHGKRTLLSHILRSGGRRQTLVFTRTKHGANRLARQLAEDGLECAAIHGNKSQGARTRALADFKAGRIEVLVATDIAARGLDIAGLPQVVNYELPRLPEDYVHRIGRTGRAGCDGRAVSLVSSEERGLLRAIERTLGRSIAIAVAPAAAPYAMPAASKAAATVAAAASPAPAAQPRDRESAPRGAGSGRNGSRFSRRRSWSGRNAAGALQWHRA